RLQVGLHDTPNGLQAQIDDVTTGQSGSMTASPSNGFAQIKYDPTGTSCDAIPYAFHPMYSTSSEQTRVIWAAHSYNVAFSDEIGHLYYCTRVRPEPSTPPCGMCPTSAKEGLADDREHAEGAPRSTAPGADDNFCFRADQSTLVPITGCQGSNGGFDGVPYKPLWADGNPDHAGAFFFTGFRTGQMLNLTYSRVAFEADLPRIEIAPAFQN